MVDINMLMKQAQQVQAEVEKIQKETETMEFSGTSAGNLVSCTVNGKKEVLDLIISDEAMTEDKDMLEDMILSAVNKALNTAELEVSSRMENASKGLKLPF